MTSYRTSARSRALARLPALPDVRGLRLRAAALFAAQLGIAAGVVGWLAVSPLAHGGPWPYTPEGRLQTALPALVSTTLLTAGLVFHVVRHSRPFLRTIALGTMLGSANGFLYFSVREILDGEPSRSGFTMLAGTYANIVSLPLGLVFGFVLGAFAVPASRLLAHPTHETPSAVSRLGALGLFLAAAVSMVVGWLSGQSVLVGIATTGVLATLGALSMVLSRLEVRAIDRLRLAVRDDVHPALVAVPLADARIETGIASLDGAAATFAIVTREEEETPLRGKPTAIALVSASTAAESSAP